MGKILSISLKLYFIPNTLGCYSLGVYFLFFMDIDIEKNSPKKLVTYGLGYTGTY